MRRLSIPGNLCVHCGAVMGELLACPGCGWTDPLTKGKGKYPMNVPEFIDHVVMLMRGDRFEWDGWDENCVRIAAKGEDRIVVEFEDGSEFELVARSTTTDLRQAGVRYWLAKLLGGVKSEKAKDVVRSAKIEKPND